MRIFCLKMTNLYGLCLHFPTHNSVDKEHYAKAKFCEIHNLVTTLVIVN